MLVHSVPAWVVYCVLLLVVSVSDQRTNVPCNMLIYVVRCYTMPRTTPLTTPSATFLSAYISTSSSPRTLLLYNGTCYISGVALLGSVDETADGHHADGSDIGGILYEWVECGSP